MSAATPTKAAHMIRVLRLLFSFAERRDMIPKNSNPATNMRIASKAKKQQIWEPSDIEVMVKKADQMDYFSMGTAIMINEWMGQRSGDIIAMTMNAYKNGSIYITQSKTGAQVELPVDIVDKLRHRIEKQIQLNRRKEIPGTHLIQQNNGKPFKADWFTHLFVKIRAAALKGLPAEQHKHFSKLTFQTLRHTAVTRLGETGCEIPEIASITGHSFKACQEIIDRYGVRTEKMAQNAYHKRIKQENKE